MCFDVANGEIFGILGPSGWGKTTLRCVPDFERATKVHLACDRQGLPLATVLTAGQRHETIVFTDLMDAVSVPRPRGRPRKRPGAVAGDRAYDADWIRQWCRD